MGMIDMAMETVTLATGVADGMTTVGGIAMVDTSIKDMDTVVMAMTVANMLIERIAPVFTTVVI
jgi:hypothetical protein